MAQLYCGVEDEVFFVDNRRWAKLFQSKKKRRIPLSQILQEAPSTVATPKGIGDAFWTNYGGLIYAESTATEFATPLIEQGKDCVENLVQAVLLQRAKMVRMKEEAESTGKKLNVEGWSTHYNFGVDSFIDQINLNDAHRIVTYTEFEKWPKFTADLAHILIKTVGPAYFALLEDDVSSGFMYRVRNGSRFELCGDFMPDTTQLGAGLAFVLGTLHGISNVIKSVVRTKVRSQSSLLQTYESMTDNEIFENLPLWIPDINYRRVTSKVGIGAHKNFIENMKQNGSHATFSDAQGRTQTPLAILQTYFNHFEEEIEAYASSRQLALLKDIMQQKHPLQIDIPNHPKFYFDITQAYVEAFTGGRSDEEVLNYAATTMGGLQAVYADFVANPMRNIDGSTIECKAMGWDAISLLVNGKETKVGRDSVVKFHTALKNNDLSLALEYVH